LPKKKQQNTLILPKKLSETDIINMLEFLIDNIFVIFGGRVFSPDSRHTYGYKLCSSSRLFVAFWYEADFIQGLLKQTEDKLARCFNFTFRYIDDVLSLNNSRFGDFVVRIYPIEFEMEDTTDTDKNSSYFHSSYINILYFSYNVSILSI